MSPAAGSPNIVSSLGGRSCIVQKKHGGVASWSLKRVKRVFVSASASSGMTWLRAGAGDGVPRVESNSSGELCDIPPLLPMTGGTNTRTQG